MWVNLCFTKPVFNKLVDREDVECTVHICKRNKICQMDMFLVFLTYLNVILEFMEPHAFTYAFLVRAVNARLSRVCFKRATFSCVL